MRFVWHENFSQILSLQHSNTGECGEENAVKINTTKQASETDQRLSYSCVFDQESEQADEFTGIPVFFCELAVTNS